MNIDRILKQLDFDDSEVKMYMSSLELGTAKITDITTHAGIGRTLGYHVIDKLVEYGAVEQVHVQDSPIAHYAPKHPDALVEYAEQKNETWKDRVKNVEDRLDDILSLYRGNARPLIRLIEGKKALQQLIDDVLASDSELLTVFDMAVWKENGFQEYDDQFERARVKKGQTSKTLFIDTPVNREIVEELWDETWDKYAENRWAKRDLLDPLELDVMQTGAFDVIDDKIIISMVQPNEYFAIFIESAPLAKTIKILFSMAWSNAEELRKSS